MLVDGDLFAGRYRVLRALKSGAMGWVYVAEHVGTSQRVALKLMRPDIVASPELRAKFAQEARVAAMIQSRHVVAVTDSGVEGATPFLVMELLEGQELGEVLAAQGPLPAPLVASILAQLAKGLDKAHAAGVIHRDLKPENVFLARDEDGELVVKILDFGIAKVVQGAGSSTVAGGTPLYMAPEQTRSGSLTPAADIWAFGLIAYRMLAGKPYWQAQSLAELHAEIVGGSYPAPSGRSPAPLPAGFDDVFARCVALDPTQRFASAGDAARALAAVLHAVDTTSPADALIASSIRRQPALATIAGPTTGTAVLPGATAQSGVAPGSLAATLATRKQGRSLGRRWLVVSIALLVVGLGTLLIVRLATHGLGDFTGASSSGKPARKRAPSAAVETSPPPAAPETPAVTPSPSAPSTTQQPVPASAPPIAAPPPTAAPPPPPVVRSCAYQCRNHPKERLCRASCQAQRQ